MIMKYQEFLNEELKHLPPPSDEETDEAFDKLTMKEQVNACIKYKLPEKYLDKLRDEEYFTDKNADTFFQSSIYQNYLEGVQYTLLNLGVNINQIFDDGNNALSEALNSQNYDIFKYLVERGADVNLKVGIEKTTPLHKLIQYSMSDHIDLIQLLLDHGADINAKDKYFHTPLSTAIYSGKLNIVKYLLEHGADVNMSSKFSPLYIALQMNNYEIFKCLVEHGADIHFKTKNGKTIFDYYPNVDDPKLLDYIEKLKNKK